MKRFQPSSGAAQVILLVITQSELETWRCRDSGPEHDFWTWQTSMPCTYPELPAGIVESSFCSRRILSCKPFLSDRSLIFCIVSFVTFCESTNKFLSSAFCSSQLSFCTLSTPFVSQFFLYILSCSFWGWRMVSGQFCHVFSLIHRPAFA